MLFYSWALDSDGVCQVFQSFYMLTLSLEGSRSLEHNRISLYKMSGHPDVCFEVNTIHFMSRITCPDSLFIYCLALTCYVEKFMHECGRNSNSDCVCIFKGPVKLIQWVKRAPSFLESASNLFHSIILSLPL